MGLKAKASTTDFLKLNLFIVNKSMSGYLSFEGDAKDSLTKIIQSLMLQTEKMFKFIKLEILCILIFCMTVSKCMIFPKFLFLLVKGP